MSDAAWNVGETIPVEIFVADPTNGEGLTGQIANITFSIQRQSDNKYWTGAAWSATFTTLTVTEPDSTNQQGRYRYVLSAAANAAADRYLAHVIVDNPPLINSMENYELYVSRSLVSPADVNIYESESA